MKDDASSNEGHLVENFSEMTRAIYHKQHMRVAADRTAMERFIGMFSTDYFGLSADFFRGKRCLDAGCGDTAKLLIALWRMGAKELCGIDLGTDFIPVATESVSRNGIASESIAFTSGSILELPYPDEHFDFVACHGVLLHLNSMDEVDVALSELARVTRPGGYLYTVYGIDGGLFEEAIKPALRKYYRENDQFRGFVDNLAPEDIWGVFEHIGKGMSEHVGESVDLSPIRQMFDMDYCVTVQNILQAPVQLKIKADYVEGKYAEHGFEGVEKLKRYVKRGNIRRFAAPLHYDRDFWFSKLVYGNGSLEYIARKKQG